MKALVFLFVFSLCMYSGEPTSIKTGLGVGNGYGWVGGGLELERNQIAAHAGFGWAFLAGDDVEATFLGWDVGLKYFLRNRQKTFRPNIAIGLGNLYVYKYGFTSRATGVVIAEYDGSILGFDALLGFDLDFGQPGGVVPNLGIGAGIPFQDLPQELKDLADESNVEIAEINSLFVISLGVKYQF